MTDGKIYIIVTNKLPGGVGPGPGPKPSEKEEKDEDLFSHWAKNRLISLGKGLAKKAVMYPLSNIGNFTGNYVAQTQINNSLSVVNSLLSIGTAAFAGFKLFGPPGAAIAASIAVINETVSYSLQSISNWVENQKINYNIDQLRDRSGMNATLDGSRGTEN